MITSIKQISNETYFPVSFLKRENFSDQGYVLSHNSNFNEVWIPWCTNSNEFQQKVLILNINQDAYYYIWQTGPYIYSQMQHVSQNTVGKHYYNDPINGYPAIPNVIPNASLYQKGVRMGPAHGDRRLIIRQKERKGFFLEQFFTLHLL